MVRRGDVLTRAVSLRTTCQQCYSVTGEIGRSIHRQRTERVATREARRGAAFSRSCDGRALEGHPACCEISVLEFRFCQEKIDCMSLFFLASNGCPRYPLDLFHQCCSFSRLDNFKT